MILFRKKVVSFVNRYTPTGHIENILIDCGDGIKFHAPADEFEIISQ